MEWLIFGLALVMLFGGIPVAVALGLTGVAAIMISGDSLVAVPTNVYTAIAKYPLIALPMFVLVGCVFDRAGVALRLVRFATALVGAGRGALATVAIIVAMMMGGISGSGPATAAAVGQVVTGSMIRDGYPRSFIASTVAAASATDILIPPSLAFIIYAVLVPGVSVPAIFIAGLFPGLLAGLAIMVPIITISLLNGFGGKSPQADRPGVWVTFKEAIWGLLAPVIILGGMRIGAFTPTEAAVIAVFYGLFIGFFVYGTLTLKDLYGMLIDAAELSAIILIVVGLASVFAWATSTLGIMQSIADSIMGLGLGEYGTIGLLLLALIFIGMFLDGISIFLILLPILIPIALSFDWNLVWFGVVLTLTVAIGQFTPPLAVNLMVSCEIAKSPIEETVPWVLWLLLSMTIVTGLVILVPDIALWLPETLGYR